MGISATKVSAMYDAAASVLLRAASDGAETATATETAVSLNELDTAYWHDGEIPYGVFEVDVHISALDTTSDETYVLELLVDDTSNMSDTPRVVSTLNLATRQTGFYRMLVDSKNIPKLDTDSSGTEKYLAIRATLGGTTPSITYGAWMSRTIRG